MSNLANIYFRRTSHRDDNSGLKAYDTFENVLIFGQRVLFDIWRMIQDNVMDLESIKINRLTNVRLFWMDEEKKAGFEFDATKYMEIWTDGGIGLESTQVSKNLNDCKIAVIYRTSSGTGTKTFSFTSYKFKIMADYKRNGQLSDPTSDNMDWEWGKEQNGPVLMVDCTDKTQENNSCDFSINLSGPNSYPDNIVPVLQLQNAIDPQRVAIYDNNMKLFIGGTQIRWKELDFSTGNSLSFQAYATQYADRDFDGLIRIGVNFAVKEGEDLIPIFREVPSGTKNPGYPFIASVQFRVAPWIMTPSTQLQEKLYVDEVSNAYFDQNGYQKNTSFIKQLQNAIGTNNVEIIPEKFNRNDPWAQDEIKFGYSQYPSKEGAVKCLSVVLNSPRNRGLDTFPIVDLFKSGKVGYITRGGTGKKSSLDSFGNLDVTPPVRGYPMGRIYYGGSRSDDPESRNMTLSMRDFLDYQIVQKPFQLYTDWLLVGHVDEMVSFIPDRSKPEEPDKFKVVMPSSHVFKEIVEKVKELDVKFFEGKRNIAGKLMEKTPKELLNWKEVWDANDRYMSRIQYNKGILKRELGITDEDFIDIPALYYSDESNPEKASAYMPGMVNLVVWGDRLLIPKPFGALIDGECCVESYVKQAMAKLELTCYFIDDWYYYHIADGEVHCGTNVKRLPFDFKWWEIEPSELGSKAFITIEEPELSYI